MKGHKMPQMANWEIEEPWNDLMGALKRHPNIRGREDVNEHLRKLAAHIQEVDRQMSIAVHKQVIEDADAARRHAEEQLAKICPMPF